jgi:hypothetical protein
MSIPTLSFNKLYSTEVDEAKRETSYVGSASVVAAGALLALASAALVAAYLLNAHSVITLSHSFSWISTIGSYNFIIGGVGFAFGTTLVVAFAIKIHKLKKNLQEKLNQIDQKFENKAFEGEFLDILSSSAQKSKVKSEDYHGLQENQYVVSEFKGKRTTYVIIARQAGNLVCTKELDQNQRDVLVDYLVTKGYSAGLCLSF